MSGVTVGDKLRAGLVLGMYFRDDVWIPVQGVVGVVADVLFNW